MGQQITLCDELKPIDVGEAKASLNKEEPARQALGHSNQIPIWETNLTTTSSTNGTEDRSVIRYNTLRIRVPDQKQK